MHRLLFSEDTSVVDKTGCIVACDGNSECISTPGRLEKYAWPQWESNYNLWNTSPMLLGCNVY
jgi:hypothetical protein